MKHILILDAGGVIIEDIGIQAWSKIAALSQNSSLQREQLYAHYKKEVSEKLWTGKLTEQQFVDFLSDHDIIINVAELRDIIASCLTPLPAFFKVREWAQHMPVYIMSNHVTAWLTPALEPLKPYITECYISDSVNIKKPTIDWFNQINSRHANTSIMFIDNTSHNIEAAKQVGWHTMLADPTFEWIPLLDNWVKQVKAIKG